MADILCSLVLSVVSGSWRGQFFVERVLQIVHICVIMFLILYGCPRGWRHDDGFDFSHFEIREHIRSNVLKNLMLSSSIRAGDVFQRFPQVGLPLGHQWWDARLFVQERYSRSETSRPAAQWPDPQAGCKALKRPIS